MAGPDRKPYERTANERCGRSDAIWLVRLPGIFRHGKLFADLGRINAHDTILKADLTIRKYDLGVSQTKPLTLCATHDTLCHERLQRAFFVRPRHRRSLKNECFESRQALQVEPATTADDESRVFAKNCENRGTWNKWDENLATYENINLNPTFFAAIRINLY
jgi:hypothetical protein